MLKNQSDTILHNDSDATNGRRIETIEEVDPEVSGLHLNQVSVINEGPSVEITTLDSIKETQNIWEEKCNFNFSLHLSYNMKLQDAAFGHGLLSLVAYPLPIVQLFLLFLT